MSWVIQHPTFLFVDKIKSTTGVGIWPTGTDGGYTAYDSDAPTDTDGWPIIDCQYDLYPTKGLYVMTFTGQASASVLAASANMGSSIVSNVYDTNTNTSTVMINQSMDFNEAIGVVLRNTKRTPSSTINSGVTNVVCYNVADDQNVTYYPNRIAELNGYKHIDFTLLTVITSNTGPAIPFRWSGQYTNTQVGRRRPAEPYQTPNNTKKGIGFAWERLIELANLSNLESIYIVIPVTVDNDYILNLAKTIKYGTDGSNPYNSPQVSPVYAPLNGNTKVYIGTVSTSPLSQTSYDSDYVLSTLQSNTGQADPLHANGYRYALSIWWNVTVSELFRSVFGDTEFVNRIRVLCAMPSGGAQSPYYVTNQQNNINTYLTYANDVWGPSSPYDTMPLGNYIANYPNPRRNLNEYFYGAWNVASIAMSPDHNEGNPYDTATVAQQLWRSLLGPCTETYFYYDPQTGQYTLYHDMAVNDWFPQACSIIASTGLKVITSISINTPYGYDRTRPDFIQFVNGVKNWYGTIPNTDIAIIGQVPVPYP